jgi:hypothetical protein
VMRRLKTGRAIALIGPATVEAAWSPDRAVVSWVASEPCIVQFSIDRPGGRICDHGAVGCALWASLDSGVARAISALHPDPMQTGCAIQQMPPITREQVIRRWTPLILTRSSSSGRHILRISGVGRISGLLGSCELETADHRTAPQPDGSGLDVSPDRCRPQLETV